MAQSLRERRINVEECGDTPSLRDLYMVVMEMTTKYTKLERQLTKLCQSIGVKKQKLNLTDWLNTSYSKQSVNYTGWLTQITIERKHLECIFKSGYIAGMSDILKQIVSVNDETRPLRALKCKDNVLYIYRSDQTWTVLEPDVFAQLINVLDKQCMNEFIRWQRENKSNIKNDSFAITFAENVIKIMGDGLTPEQINSRLKRELYNYLKEDTPSAVDLSI